MNIPPGKVMDGIAITDMKFIAKELLEAPASALQHVKEYLKGNANFGFEKCICVEHDKKFHEILLKRVWLGVYERHL